MTRTAPPPLGPVGLLTASLSLAALGGRRRPNRRSEVRRSLYMACRVRRLRDLRWVADRLLDLSPQGMLALSDEVLEPGAELFVSFRATELPLWFDTRAVVARVIQDRRVNDTGRAIGLRFLTLPAVSRVILRGHLRKTAMTEPRRARPLDLGPAADPDYAQIVKDILEG
jgi:hypothetical protein